MCTHTHTLVQVCPQYGPGAKSGTKKNICGSRLGIKNRISQRRVYSTFIFSILLNIFFLLTITF